MQVSVLGFGGAEIGFEKARQEDVVRLLNEALDAGLNVIDTAECYMDSEEKIGKAVSGRRKDFHLFTKCGHPDSPGVADWRPDSLLKSIERSLQRLKTDRVDLVQLHTCTLEDLKKGDVISALQKARDKGYARFIGYSGDSKAAKYAIECGAFDSLQTSVSIADQEAVELTIPLARARGMGVIAKRPLGNAVWRHSTRPDNGYHQPYWDRIQKLKYDFLKDDAEQVSSTALRFTLSIPGIDVAIVGTKNPERWKANANLLEAGPLPADQFEAIRKRWKETADVSWIGLT
jgi:aryl-alcohol dehydrogenase-like predicted oxidoreductase